MAPKEFVNLPVSREFRDWLKRQGTMEDTYESVLRRLLDLPSEGLPDAGIKDTSG